MDCFVFYTQVIWYCHVVYVLGQYENMCRSFKSVLFVIFLGVKLHLYDALNQTMLR